MGFKKGTLSEESIKKMRDSHLGKTLSDEQKNKIKKGVKNHFLLHPMPKGTTPWNFGKTNVYSKITLEKMSLAKKGKGFFTGKKHTDESKDIMRRSKLQKPTKYWLGKKLPKHVIDAMINRNKGKWLGKNNPNWADGKSFEDYPREFSKEFKELIRIRDDYLCIGCGISQKESLILYNRILHVHHIDYNKKNCTKENCCTLCVRCNAGANSKRETWTNYYTTLMNKKYGYNYCKEEK